MTGQSGPVGVFDSGVGGLTVVGALLRRYPGMQVLYVADQAHVPYGGRPLEEVRCFAKGISDFLAGQGCSSIVMACNISSATALPCVSRALAPLPVLGVIIPAARRACLPAPSPGAAPEEAPRIGVLATEGTVRSGAYDAAIRRCCPQAEVYPVPCPRFVPLVEAGALETPDARDAAREYLAPLAAVGCDRIVLGCTHYPFLLPVLHATARDMFTSPVAFIDPADEMADVLRTVLPDIENAHPETSGRLLTTGCPDRFRAQSRRFLPGLPFTVDSARWQGNVLRHP